MNAAARHVVENLAFHARGASAQHCSISIANTKVIKRVLSAIKRRRSMDTRCDQSGEVAFHHHQFELRIRDQLDHLKDQRAKVRAKGRESREALACALIKVTEECISGFKAAFDQEQRECAGADAAIRKLATEVLWYRLLDIASEYSESHDRDKLIEALGLQALLRADVSSERHTLYLQSLAPEARASADESEVKHKSDKWRVLLERMVSSDREGVENAEDDLPF
jgi:hypothetical protein